MGKIITVIAMLYFVHLYQADLSTWLQKTQLTFEQWLAFYNKKTQQINPVIYSVSQGIKAVDKQVPPALETESAMTDDLPLMIPDTRAICWSVDDSFKQALVCRCGPLEGDLKSQCHQSIRDEYLTVMLEHKL